MLELVSEARGYLKNRPIILKIGGSVITDKLVPMKIRYNVIHRIAREIRKYLSERSNSRLIIVHGGGSIGHYLVKKLRVLELGWDERKYSIISNEMLRLSLTISSILNMNKVPAVIVTTHALFVLNKDNKIIDNNIGVKVLESYLLKSLIPILYGDAVVKVLNGSIEFKILSGDDISWYLAGKLNALKLLFATSVNGVYDRNPSHPNARLLKEVSLDKISYMDSKLKGYDVTGGMLNKLRAGIRYADILPKDLEVIVFNGLVEDNIYRALKGNLGTCTKVKI